MPVKFCNRAHSFRCRKVVPEAVVVIDDVGNNLLDVVSVNVIAPAALCQEHFCTEVAVATPFAAPRVRQRERGYGSAHRPNLIDEGGTVVAMADRQANPVLRLFNRGGLVPFFQLRHHGLECIRDSGLDVIGNLLPSRVADYGPKSTPPQESSVPGNERRRLQTGAGGERYLVTKSLP